MASPNTARCRSGVGRRWSSRRRGARRTARLRGRARARSGQSPPARSAIATSGSQMSCARSSSSSGRSGSARREGRRRARPPTPRAASGAPPPRGRPCGDGAGPRPRRAPGVSCGRRWTASRPSREARPIPASATGAKTGNAFDRHLLAFADDSVRRSRPARNRRSTSRAGLPGRGPSGRTRRRPRRAGRSGGGPRRCGTVRRRRRSPRTAGPGRGAGTPRGTGSCRIAARPTGPRSVGTRPRPRTHACAPIQSAPAWRPRSSTRRTGR